MLNDFMPVINNFMTADFEGRMTIIPLADAHYGSREFNEVRWHNTIKRIQDDPKCFCVLVGDLIDNGLKNSVTNIYEATASPSEQKEWLYNELKPIGEKILGAVGGNHERRTAKEADQDPLFDVMLRLGKEDKYRQNICFMKLRFEYMFNGKRKQRYGYNIAITHGAGGGMYIASAANRLQNYGQVIEGLDLLITGHTHRPLTFPVSKLVFTEETIIQRQFVVAVASSFLDYGGYPAQKMLLPAAHTTTEIQLSFGHDKKHIRVLQ